MIFDAGEVVLFSEHDVETRGLREKGNLLLTNKRLVLEITKESKRMIFIKDKQDMIALNLQISSILLADKKKDVLFKGHEFTVNANGNQYLFKVKDPQLWISQIASAKSGNLTFNQPENNLKPTSEVRKVSPDKEGISSVHVQSIEVIKIRCSRCHMLVDENAKFCPSCGSLMG